MRIETTFKEGDPCRNPWNATALLVEGTAKEMLNLFGDPSVDCYSYFYDWAQKVEIFRQVGSTQHNAGGVEIRRQRRVFQMDNIPAPDFTETPYSLFTIDRENRLAQIREQFCVAYGNTTIFQVRIYLH